MRNLILAVAGLASLAAPLGVQAYPGEVRDDRREVRQDRQQLRDDRRDGDRLEFRDDRREYRDDRRELRDDRRDLRDVRRDDRGFGYRDNDRGDSRRYDAGRYAYPRGYTYRAWGVGAFLPRAYWGGSYLIGRPNLYGLGYARPRTHWVRVGPDALLIRDRDGAVVEVIRGRFY